jgi:hypothetical protein
MTHSSVGGFGRRRACLRRVARNWSPYCRTIAAAGFNRMPTPPRIRATGADIRIGGKRAFYAPSADYVQVPHVWRALPRRYRPRPNQGKIMPIYTLASR